MHINKIIRFSLCFLLALALSKALPAAESPRVGTIRMVINEVKIKSAKGEERAAEKNGPVFKNDEVITGAESKIKILFENDNILILGFDSRLMIDEVVYDPESQESNSLFNLLKGKVRAIVKKFLSPKSQFKIRTANSDIGVLGTDFVLIFDNEAGTLEAFVESGSIKIESPDQSWNDFNLQQNFYTKIEGSAKPADPKPIKPDTFTPIKNELTIYEDINPQAGSDFTDFVEGQAQAEEPLPDEEGITPQTQPTPPPVPPIDQEPLTGTVKVKVTTEFP